VRKEISENILLFSSRFLTQREYWEKKLAGDFGETTLLLHKMNLNQKPVIKAEDIFLPSHICRQLINISKNFDLSIYIILLTALKTLIFRYTLNEDITVLSPLYKLNISKDTINDRLFIRDRITGNMTFKELTLEVKKSVVEAYKHQDYPFEKLFELLFPDSRIEDMPISNLECSLKNIHKETNRGEIRGKISFSFVREEDKIKGNILYDSNIYEKFYIQQMLNHCVKVLETGIHDINITIGEISFLSEREKRQLLIDFNNNKANFPRDKSIHQLFESQAHKNSLYTALKFDGEQLTYSELKERVDWLAGVLRRRGIGKDKLVGVLLERSSLMAESILAIWKAGGAYIPIDPQYPFKRIIGILNDSNAEVLLTTDKWNRPELEGAFGEIIIRLDQPLDGLTGDSLPGTEVEGPMDMDSLAYVIYTSGSTGKPKGAMVEHLGMMNHIQAKIHDLQLTGESIIAQNASHTFDISVWQFFTAFTIGAKTVIYPDELVLNPGRFISQVVKDQVTILEIVPSYLAVLLEFLEGETFAPLVVNYLLVTGETVKPALVKKWFEKYPGIKMVNAYGPTEASDDITHHIMDNAPDIEQVPIGKSLQNLNIYIVDKRMQLCPIGVKGEIYVSGVGVGRGYLNNLERTTEVFMGNPFVSPITNDRFYRTGDLGCWFPDGTILFFGRKDYQVKIRGYRIELGEIENQLLKHEKIKDAVVIDRESHTGGPGKGKGETYLCAYIVLNVKSGVGTAGEKSLAFLTELKEYLSERLPEYMIPPKFLFLEKLPLTTSGKVDRKALPVPDEVSVEKYIAPRDEVEKKLAQIWSEVLDRDAWDASIGIDNNFFEMGGHSLKASVIAWKIHKELNVKIPLAEIFEIPTIRGLAEYIKGTAENRYASIEPVEKKEFYVLSSAQKRLYILHQMDPESTAYNIPEVIPLGEEPDLGKFEETFIKLINCHESLRTSFHMIGDEPSQRIHDKVEFAIGYYDLTAKTREDTRSENEIHRSSFIIHHFVRPFDLSQAPLLRVGLIKTGDVRYLLMVDMHHIISDGVSHDILVRDFMKLYEGREVALLRIQYKDFSKWQNRENEKENLKHQEAHWLKEFAGEIPVLDLQADYVRPTIQSFEGSVLVFEVPVEEIEAIKALALGHGSTLFMALLSVFYVFLSRLSGQEDIIVGTPIAGRRHADLEKIIGMFVNTLALRNYPTGEKSFLEFLEEVKQQTLEAFENQEYQFEDLVEKVAIERNTGRNPLFDVMFVLQNINTEHDDSSREQITEDSGNRSAQDSTLTDYQNIIQTSQFDFTFNAIERDEGFLFSFLYCTKLFKKETIERFATTYKKIISSIAKEPGMKLSQIEVIGEEERNQVLYNFNNTDCPYPGDKSLHQLFEDQAAKRGDSIAVISMEHGTRSTNRTVGIGTMSITYRQLNEKSDQLACYLREKGVTPDCIVGIMVERSLEMIVGIFGILKAGGAYLPIDSGYPQERVRYMLTDSNAKILVSGVNEVIDLNQLTDATTPTRLSPPTYPLTHSPTQRSPSNLAYIIYTSGSTGRPKGVMLQHRSVVNRLNWMQKAYPIGYEDIILQKTPYIFDVSVWEIFWWSLHGASVCLLACGEEKNPGAIIDAIEKNKVTTMHFVPAMLNTFLAYLEDETVEKRRLTSLRQVFASGEALEVIHVEQFNRLIHKKTGAMLINLYGPTEAAVDVSFFDCSPSPGLGRIPIGKPIDNIQLYIVNRYFRLQPIGIAGELCISGVGLARGYLNNPELTAERFSEFFIEPQREYIIETTVSSAAKKLYKTGDLAKWRPDGNIDFLGRIDSQVKIRGFRIELGEIENQMLSYGQIKEAVVTIVKDKSGDNALAAYFILDSEIQENELREYLLKFLPDYMIPSYFIRLDNIPLTPTGKIDRKALPAPGIKVGKEYVGPRNGVEEKLAEIWEDVLGIEKSVIGIDTNFFQLGGHSLNATIMASRIHKALNAKVSLGEIFKSPTIRGLAEYIKSIATDRYASIEPVEEKEYYRLSSAQKRLYILQQIDPENTAYNMPEIIPLEEEPDIEKFKEIFKILINRHESLRTSFHMIGGEPVQKIHKKVNFKIEDYIPVGAEKQGGLAPLSVPVPDVTQIIKNFVRPFDLSQTPLLKVGLLKNPDGQNLLLVDMHHIISDGASQQILVEDFMTFYGGEVFAPLQIQYKDFSEWQNCEQEKEKIKQQETFWLKELSGEIPVLHIPNDYSRPAIQSFEGGDVDFKIPAEDTRVLKAIALKENATLYMVLLAAFNILLAKLSSQEDIIIGTPVVGRRHADLEKVIGMFVNTLALRNYPTGEKIFAEFLEEVKERTLEAFENQEYQFEELVEKVEVKRDAGRNPLFDVMFVLQNVDIDTDIVQDEWSGEVIPEEDRSVQDIPGYNSQDIFRTSKFDLTLSVMVSDRKLLFSVQYCTKLFKKETIERFIQYFKNVVKSIIEEPKRKLSQVEMIPGEEKERLLYDFNDTDCPYPADKTLHRLFEEQVERRPDSIAVISQKTRRRAQGVGAPQIVPFDGIHHVTYKELNQRSNQLAYFLQEKGVKPDTIVGIMVNRSVEMVIGIMGILKAGGAYLPIEPGYPGKRIDYIFKDGGVQLLLTEQSVIDQIKINLEVIYLEEPGIYTGSVQNLEDIITPEGYAYALFTSGSTGKPKGVLIEHGSVVNMLYYLYEEYPFTPGDVYLFKTSVLFDVSVSELFGWFIGGGRLAILENEAEKDPQKIIEVIKEQTVTHINFVPSMFNTFLGLLTPESIDDLSGLKYIFLAGEALSAGIVNRFRTLNRQIQLENLYGPTEGTIYASKYSLSSWSGKGNISIGRPAQNVKLYILSTYGYLQPVGVAGELFIAGIGLARGYLNKPELTAEKFLDLASERHEDTRISSSISHHSSCRFLYRTGDLAKWRPDGNIDFLGRIDYQVKVRGVRIELGEIENHLLAYRQIKEPVVTAVEDDSGDKTLVAYFISDHEIQGDELREYLLKSLPGYMIPSYFMQLDQMPLTPTGKIDRKALPAPGIKAVKEYVAPRNEIEEKLAEIWGDVLGIGKREIGIDANFFYLGGHSLKAMIMVSKVHEALNVKVSLGEIFKAPTIRGLAEYIKGAATDRYASIEPAEKREYYALSPAQRRLYILQQMEFGSTTYNIPEVIPLEEKPDPEKFEETFIKLINHHESLRTSFHMIGDKPVQRIHDNVEFEIEYSDLQSTQVEVEEVNIIHHFIRPFDLSQAPLLKVGLLNIPGGQNLLLVDMHHIISDGVSQQIFLKDFMALYTGEVLAPLQIHYKDFSEWQLREKEKETIKQQEAYWLKEFSGEIPVLHIPTDYSRPAIQNFEGSDVDFKIPADDTSALKAIALEENATLYMVLLAVFNILLSKLSSQEDIVIGTPIVGRRHADLERLIGMFVNTLALRNYPGAEKTFREFLANVKERALEAIENQEYQFEELVEKVSVYRDASRNPLFDVMFTLQNFGTNAGGGLEEAREIEKEKSALMRQEGGKNILRVSKFDMTLGGVESGESLFFTIEYCTKLFKKETIKRFFAYFKKIISLIVKEPGIKLSEIEIMSEEEKIRLLYDFNDTGAEYPKDKTIHQLFEEQAAKAGDGVAVVGMEHGAWSAKEAVGARDGKPFHNTVSLTYRELNEKSNRLAWLLREKGVNTGTIVGIMVERSIEMIIGLMGILKAGGAYLPIDPGYPEERISYMLQDSNAEIFLSTRSLSEKIAFKRKIIYLEGYKKSGVSSESSCHASLASASLAYVIYTSGSTGNPKGVTIEHSSLVNRLNWMQKRYPIGPGDMILQKTVFTFDVSVWELFWWSIQGASVCLLAPGEEKDPAAIIGAVERNKVTTMHFVPSMLNSFLEYMEEFRTVDPEIDTNADDSDRRHPFRMDDLRYVFSSGEALQAHLVEQFNKLLNETYGTKLINLYGPTEATIDVSYYDCWGKVLRDNIPIGKPIHNIQLYVVDKGMHLQGIGIIGELGISGDGLARGYLNNPELTAEKFIDNPYGEQPGRFDAATDPHSLPHSHTPSPLYRTGDLARWRQDGNIEFFGRLDHQIKIRGFRIELGEIENVLLAHDKIKEAVITVRGDSSGGAYTSSGEKYLCAYIVSVGTFDNTFTELKEYLSRSLPDYMIPTYFMEVDNIPLTPSGKVDRKELPSPMVKGRSEYIAPRNSIEKKLAEIWSDVLGSPGTLAGELLIGIDDNFFGLGGHSLKATVMVLKIHKELDVKIPLAAIFKTPTIRGLAEFIKGTAEDRYASIEPSEEKEYYVLSSAQKRLYILQQMDIGNTAYNMPEVIPLEEEPDIEKFEETFKQLINCHESLRTSFHMIGDEPVQRIYDKVEFEIDYYDLAAKTRKKTRRENEIYHSHQSFIEQFHHFVRPFDLSQAPLLRVGLIKTGDAKYLLLVDMHHIISDAISHGVLVEDFTALYNGEELPLLRIQYKDFSVWQNSEKEKENINRQEAYWLNEFVEDVPILNLATDYVRQSEPSFEGTTLNFEMGPEETKALKRLAMQEGVTLYMVLLTFFNILLHKLSGQEDIVVGTPVMGRRHADLQGIIGMFVNTLALRNYPKGEKGFKGFLTEVKERTLEAFENQEYQFEDLVGKIEIDRDISRNPLFNVMFSMQDIKVDLEEDLESKKDTVNHHSNKYEYEESISKFDLSLDVAVGEKLLFMVEYSTKLFKKATIERFIRYFEEISDALIKNREKKISEIEILTGEEKRQLLLEFNDTDMDMPYPLDITVQELFEKQVERTPDHIAVVGQSHGIPGKAPGERGMAVSLSYKELNEKSNQLAFYLRKRGIKPDRIVSLVLDRSVEMIVGILGVLKAGGAYSPLDPGYPEDRVEYILKESQSEIVLVDGTGLTDIELKFPEKTINLDVLAVFEGNRSNPKKVNTREDLAYVIYTSGSTGNPKGVLVEHKSVTNYVLAFLQEFEVISGDTMIQQASYTFDAFVEEVYPILLTGGNIVIPGKFEIMDMNVFTEFIVKYHVNIIDCSPMLLNELNKRFPITSDIKLFISGGDTLKADYVERLCKYGSVYNTYGPTETTVCATFYRYSDDACNRGRDFESGRLNIPIGKPIGNYRCYIVDGHNQLVPLGVPGELCISGDGVTRGYLNNPELTAEKFDQDFQDDQDDQDEKGSAAREPYKVPDNIIEGAGGLAPLFVRGPVYHTGDLARWLPNDNIEFLGRIDHQVKIRGFRIELGEIEYRILKHPDVKETVVLTQTDESYDKYLCAYIVPHVSGDGDVPPFDSGKTPPISTKFREYLTKSLPDYMIPTYFVELEKIPLTPNGKIDRNALPLPVVKGEAEYTAPRNEIEEKLAEIWSEVLGIEKDTISIKDNFFKLGGHSLKATILASKIREAFNVNIPLVELFKTPTIKSLWVYIRKAEIGDYIAGDNNLVLLKLGNTNTNHLFLVHDGTGEIESYIHFCNRLNNEFNYWGIRADRLENLTPQNWTTGGLARKYIESIKKVQPPGSGPYFIAGWSIGGTIAFEMARQLEKEKEQVAFLGLIDVKSPSKWWGIKGKAFPGKFSLISELKRIKEVFIMEFEIEEKARKIKNMEGFWLEMTDYLESCGLDEKEIKRKIERYGGQVLPNFQRLSVKECIYYLNMGRTLTRAAENYIPPDKINAPVFYFKANLSWEMKVKRWKKYTQDPIQFYELTGDHQAIFTIPYVSDFAKTFDQAVNKIVNHISPGNNVSNK